MPGIPILSLSSATHPPQADVSQAYQLGKGNQNNEILYQISKKKKKKKKYLPHYPFSNWRWINTEF